MQFVTRGQSDGFNTYLAYFELAQMVMTSVPIAEMKC